MDREEALVIILKSTIERLSNKEREEILFDWWGIDRDHPEFDKLPEPLQSEILQFNEPQRDTIDEVYNSLLFVALRKKYLGVRNEYLSKRVSEIMHSDQEVEGLQEQLHSCPCCEFKTLPTKGEYDICPVCFWEDDGNTEANNYSSPNHMTLAQARENFAKFGGVNEFSLQFLESDRFEMFCR